MPTYENTISILIKATDAASAVFDKTASNLKGTALTLDSFGKTATDVGKSLTMGVTLPMVAVGAEAGKMAMNFQQAIEMLHTNAGVAQSDLNSISQAILNMAGQVGQSPEALANAMYHIASAGQGIFTSAQMLQQLKVAAEGAAVGQANLDDTTYALTSTLAANVKGASDYNQTMGTLLAIVGSGDMKLQDLNDVIGTGLMGTLSTFGVSLQSAGAALADFGDLGERGARAGTRLRMMLALMASPSKAAAKILGDLGLTTSEVSTATGTMNEVFAKTGLTTTRLADDLRQPNGIYVAITDLKTHLEQAGLTASQTDTILSKAFGGGRTDAALLQLLDTTGRLDTKFQQINATSGNFAGNWATQQKTIKQQWDNAWASIQSDMVRVGTQLMPAIAHGLEDAANALSAMLSWYNKLSPVQKKLFDDLAFAVAVGGPVLLGLGKMATAVSSIIELMKTTQVVSKAALVTGVAADATAAEGALTGVAAVIGVAGTAGTIVGGFAALAILITTVNGLLDTMYPKVTRLEQPTENVANFTQSMAGSMATANQNAQQLNDNMNKVYQHPNASNVLSAPKGGFPPAHALGTSYAPGGMSLVGENGPELVNLPQGSQVYTAQQTSQMMGGGRSVVIHNLNVNNNVDAGLVVRQIGWQLALA